MADAVRCMILPILYSASMWMLVLYPNLAVDLFPNSFKESIRIPTTLSSSSSYNYKRLFPDNIYDSYLLGEISAKLQNLTSKSRHSTENVNELLKRASTILHTDKLTVNDVTEGVPKAIQAQKIWKDRFQQIRGLFSFIGLLSIISIGGILLTLLPVLHLLYKLLKIDILLQLFLQTFLKLKDVIDILIEPTLYCIPLLLIVATCQYSSTAARSQVGIFAAGFTLIPYFVRTLPNLVSLDRDKSFVLILSFAWCCSYLTPMAWIVKSRFLGFFAVGSLFAACGFVAFPTPFGWAAGFNNDNATERCMVVSWIIIALSLLGKVYSVHKIMDIYQTGAAVFGMLAFGLAGLIKSMYRSNSSFDYTCFLYPIVWLLLTLVGSILSYPSLTNSSITFIFLWISQMYWRILGLSSLSVFLASCILFYTTLWLKVHTDFVASLFEI